MVFITIANNEFESNVSIHSHFSQAVTITSNSLSAVLNLLFDWIVCLVQECQTRALELSFQQKQVDHLKDHYYFQPRHILASIVDRLNAELLEIKMKRVQKALLMKWIPSYLVPLC